MDALNRDRVAAVLGGLLDDRSVAEALRAVEGRVGADPDPDVALAAAVDELRARLRVADDVLVAVLADEGQAPVDRIASVLGLPPASVEEALDDYARAVAELEGEPVTPARLVFIDDGVADDFPRTDGSGAAVGPVDVEEHDRRGPGSLVWVAGVLLLVGVVAAAFAMTAPGADDGLEVREVRVVTSVDETGRPGPGRSVVDADEPVRVVVVLDGEITESAPRLELVVLRAGDAVHRSHLPLPSSSRTLIVALPAAVLGTPGEYRAVVFADGRAAAEAHVEVTR